MRLFVEKIHFDSISYRTPIKFGASVVTHIVMPTVVVRLEDAGRSGTGIGAMPLGNAWAFPKAADEQSRTAMRRLSEDIARIIDGLAGDSIFELSHRLEEMTLARAAEISREMPELPTPIPKLAALVVFSAFDIAAFDAWGKMHGGNTFGLIRATPEGKDLSHWLDGSFRGYGLERVVLPAPAESMPLFHLVGGLDPLTPAEVAKPVGDGLPEHLEEWITTDELTHLKIKLRGDDAEWDYQRVIHVDRIASKLVRGEPVYSLDFNEKCPSGMALVDLLKRVQGSAPVAFKRIAYVEQPTPRDLPDRPESQMHEAARLKPVVIDEALTDYDAFKRARALGYSGVALKACKGIGPSLLMAAACRKDKLFLCVQDLTCPGLSFLASASLAAWLGVSGIEANARQYCPAANVEWAEKRPELFSIRAGHVRTYRFTGRGLGFE